MFSIVLEIELAEKNIFKELGVFIDGNVQGYSFYLPNVYKPKEQAFCYRRKLYEIVWNSGCLDYRELLNILRKEVKAGYFAEGKEECKIPGILIDKEVENLDGHYCPKFRDLVFSKADASNRFCSN